MKPSEPSDALAASEPQSLVQFFRESPLVGLDLDLERDQNDGRDVDLSTD